MIFTPRIQQLICIILIFIQIFSTMSGYTYEWIPILSELSGGIMNWSADIAELIRERDSYSIEQSGITNITTFDSQSDLMWSTYIIEKSSRVKGEIGNRIVTSDLLYNTLIRNKSDGEMDPRAIKVHPATIVEEDSARRKFQENTKNSSDNWMSVITFEFGIPGNHLIFSKPVLLSLDAGDIPDDSWVDLLVLHAWDTDYNTSWLMTDSNGECLPDWTATKPASRAKVIGSKISFYTCGASTFALGYVPARDLPNNTVWTLAPTADNKVIIGWAFTTVWWVTMGRVARVSTGGFLDTTFTNPNANNIVYASAIQSDGKILIWWTFTTVWGVWRNRIARLNTDGTLDLTFNPIIVGTQVRAIQIQSDGKILIWWTFTTVWGVWRNRIARLNTDGTLDLTFNPNANNNVYAIAIQSDGKILLGWTFTTMWWTARTRIARVSALWVLDATFNPVLTAAAIWNIKIQTDGAIIFWWQFTIVAWVARNNIARVSTLWVLDATFNPNVTWWTPVVYAILIESSGNIIFWWAFTTVWWVTVRNRIARYSSTGVLDVTTNPNASSTVYTLGTRTDGIVAIGGLFTTIFGAANAYIAYMNPVWTPDSTYRLSINNTVWTLAPTADNKVIIGWAFTTVWWVTMGRVARVSTGGFLDTTFTNPNANNIVYASAIQSDGKILIWWTFTTVWGVWRNRIARLNTDGTLDLTFNPIIVGTQVRAIQIQSDGKILIWWTFTTVWGVWRNRIARLNTDGTLDLTFNPNANNNVYAIAIQSDGKILLGWTFTTMWWTARTRIARVSALWVLDATFNPVLTAAAIWNIKIQTDGAIIFWWQFTIVAWVARNNIARVSTLWVLDATFNPNVTWWTPVVYAILIESSGNIIFWWAFTTVWWVTVRNRIARYSSTGVLDSTLNPNANNSVYALGNDQSFNLLVGWLFTTMSAKAVPYFAWVGLNTDFVPPQIDSISLASGTLLPIGNLEITTTYSDTGVGIDVTSVAITLEKWNGTIWWSNIAATYLAAVPIITSGTGIHSLAGIPYGKYRFRTYVSDLAGNRNYIERIFYVDAIEWIVNQPSVDIGTVVWSVQKNSSPDEFIITVKTVGAGFSLTMSGSELAQSWSLIPHWTGLDGYGYE